jgi:hypothetical protein
MDYLVEGKKNYMLQCLNFSHLGLAEIIRPEICSTSFILYNKVPIVHVQIRLNDLMFSLLSVDFIEKEGKTSAHLQKALINCFKSSEQYSHL